MSAPSAVAERAAELDFNTLYREQKGRVLGAVRSILGPSDEVEDVVQLAFLEIHRCLHRFEGRSQLGTWVYRIAMNVALQHLRKRKRKRWLMLGATGDEHARRPEPTSTTGRIEDRQVLQRIYEALETLSEKKRTVWILHELEGKDPHEISAILGIPMNTARSRLLAARADLMDELGRRGVLKAGEGR